MEDLTSKVSSNGMLITDDSHHNILQSHISSPHQVGGGGSSNGGTALLQYPVRLGGQEAQYLEGLLREKESLGTSQGMDLAKRLVTQEIERIQVSNGLGARSGSNQRALNTDDRRMADVTKDKAIKLTVRVLVPVREHPKFNFVGKLLGPKGNSLKRLQEETMTKMAILGRGSMRDKKKEEDLRTSGDPKFGHLADDLHVEVTAVAPPAEAHARLAYALTEIRRYLVPDYNDEIRQRQMREMQLLNNSNSGLSAIETKENKSSSPDREDSQHSVNMITESEDESCSPSDLSVSPTMKMNGRSVMPQHPALRGITSTGKDSFISTSPKVPSNTNNRSNSHLPLGGILHGNSGRRSVLSLLTRARAIQQKEQELMEVYQEIPGYGMYDHMGELPLVDSSMEDIQGRGGGALKVTNTAVGDRSRFRHDPYTRVQASS